MRSSRRLRLLGVAFTLVALVAAIAISFAVLERESAGGAIAFNVQHGDGDAPWDIYVVSTDGRWISRKQTSWNDFDPVGSPDGRSIAFVGVNCCGGNIFGGWIYTMSPDGTHRRRLARGGEPEWSPDGRKIAFLRARGRGIDVYVMNADGTGVRRVARDAGSPHWGPDGTKIAFTGGPGDVYVVNADGSGKRRLTHNGDNDVGAWAPGRVIAFTHSAINGAGPASGIYVIDPDGTKERTVTRWDDYNSGSNGGWSADGDWLLYSTGRGVSFWRFRDGSTRRVRNTRGASSPTWGSSGREIAFTRAFGATSTDGLWLVDRDGSHARRIAAATGDDWYSGPAWTADAR